jgi:hypothetical protein
VCQILEVDDEWNILKYTLHWRRVQKISIILAILEEFLVISIFHRTKIPTVDMKVQLYSKFGKNKIWKKWNLQIPWGMEDLTLLSVGASFKKWVCCTSILPKALAHFLNFQKIKKSKICNSLHRFRCQPASTVGCPNLSLCNFLKINSWPPFFLHEVSSSWLAPTHAHPAQSLPNTFKHLKSWNLCSCKAYSEM